MGDFIRVGNEIRRTYPLRAQKRLETTQVHTFIRSLHKIMRLVLTRTVIRLQKNIEYGLEHLSNGVVGEVTVAKSNSGGRI